MTSGFGASAGQALQRLQKRFMTLLWMNRAANSSLPAGPTHRRRPRGVLSRDFPRLYITVESRRGSRAVGRLPGAQRPHLSEPDPAVRGAWHAARCSRQVVRGELPQIRLGILQPRRARETARSGKRTIPRLRHLISGPAMRRNATPPQSRWEATPKVDGRR
jgi:hypothetical protein